MLELRINSSKNKIELYFLGLPYSNIPLIDYAGFQSWISYEKPKTPYWIEIYTKQRDYQFAFDKVHKWKKMLSLLNELPIN